MLKRVILLAAISLFGVLDQQSFAQPVLKWRRLTGGPTSTARIDDGWFE